ncbi:hypothetical protein BC936DRAFT_149313 [Jimgerdemannia flammicorona]|uniref:MHD domain-containing protein n=1 Tax=Jimgerdemannia flammicorona TaxID=994334 RepID=A0A433D125_9FUNG|nr:hypothetical protein BC936DRAFT_149313 [Jimgerdemannia flammicorona]
MIMQVPSCRSRTRSWRRCGLRGIAMGPRSLRYARRFGRVRRGWVMFRQRPRKDRHQTVDENRLQVLKEIVTRFENIQSEQMLKRIEVADSTLSATIAFDVQAEIESFCSARNVVITRMSKSNPADDSGPRDVGMISKAFTIRRRTRTESSWTPSEGARSDNGEFVHDFFGESGPVPSNDSGFKTDSLAIDISGTANDEHSNAASTGSNAPSSPTSIYSSNSTAMRQGQTPKVFVDIEGYTIPPDRTAWTDMSGSQISTDFAEDESDAGSMIGGGRMRVEIKDQAVMQEPSEDASSALTRVVTVLRAKDTIVKKARGRREAARATTLSTNPPELPSGRLSPSSESTQNVSGPSSPISFDFNHRRTSSTSETNVSNPFNSPTPNPFEPAIPITSEEVTMLEPATLHTEVPHVRPQLKAYITENVSVLSKAGQVARAYFTGEISLVYMGPSEPSPSTPLCFRITNVDALERVVPNTSYINPLDKHPGVYTLDVNMFSLAGGLPVVVLKYQARVDQDDESRIVPLIIHPLWKCEDNQTLLVIRYQANHGVHFVAEPDAAASNTVITNLTFLVPVDGEVTNAQSEPSGAWNPERKKMLWHADDIVIPADGGDGGEVKKLLAKFETTTMGTPQAVAVKFTCKGRLLSTVGVVGVGRAELGRTGVNGVVNGEAVVDVVSVEKQVNSHKYVAGP